MKPIQVGLLGIGTVGRGTFEVLSRNQEEIQRRAGRGIQISMVADLDVERAGDRIAQVAVDPAPVAFGARHAGDAELVDRHAIGTGQTTDHSE